MTRVCATLWMTTAAVATRRGFASCRRLLLKGQPSRERFFQTHPLGHKLQPERASLPESRGEPVVMSPLRCKPLIVSLAFVGAAFKGYTARSAMAGLFLLGVRRCVLALWRHDSSEGQGMPRNDKRRALKGPLHTPSSTACKAPGYLRLLVSR